MFKNPLKYQQGGQLNQKQQQMLAAFIDWLPKRVKEFEGMQPEAIVQALDEMSKTPEGQRQVQAYVEQFQNEMNGVASHKLGGKIQDFICKHAKGGHVGCGCKEDGGQIEMDRRGKVISRYNDRNTRGKATSQGDTTINGSYSNFNQEMKITPQGTIYRQWNNGDVFPSVSVADQTYFNNHPLIRFFSRNFGIGPSLMRGNENVVTNMNAAKDAHQNAWVQSNQDGGELTRREALDAGMQNKGYNRSQARFALRNAKNTLRNAGVRGREMRQTARQWVAEQNEQPQSNVLSAPISYREPLPTAQPMNYLTEHNESLANLPFNEAFSRARRSGAQTFWWPRGRYKFYTTELSTTPKMDISALPEDIQNNLTGKIAVTIDDVPVNQNLVDVLDETPTSVWNFMNNMDNKSNEARPIWPIDLRKYYPAPIDNSLRGIK